MRHIVAVLLMSADFIVIENECLEPEEDDCAGSSLITPNGDLILTEAKDSCKRRQVLT